MRLGAVTARDMDSIDHELLDSGFEPAALVENAGAILALAAQQRLETLSRARIVVLVGAGGNGTDGLAAARHLVSWGALPTILLAVDRADLPPLSANQLRLAEAVNVRVFDPGALVPEADLILDALVGYGLTGPLRAEAAELVRTTERLRVPVVAVDIPSGLDPTTGKASLPAIRADLTVTLGYPKTGLLKPFAKNLVGRLLVGDVSIPASVWQRRSLTPPDFSAGPLVGVDQD